ncbi:MAG: phage head closure protein [Roseobacter sp.]
MTAPRLNRKLVLETPEAVTDGSGGFNNIWQPLGTVWAQVTARSGREAVNQGAPVSSTSYKIVVRAAPESALQRPRPDQRFREGSRLFHIQAVADTDVNARFLTCYVIEETAK